MDSEYTTLMPLKMPLNTMSFPMPTQAMPPPPLFGLRRSSKKLENDEDEDENESVSSVEMFMNMSRRASPPPIDDSREYPKETQRKGKRTMESSKSERTRMCFFRRGRPYPSAA